MPDLWRRIAFHGYIFVLDSTGRVIDRRRLSARLVRRMAAKRKGLRHAR